MASSGSTEIRGQGIGRFLREDEGGLWSIADIGIDIAHQHKGGIVGQWETTCTIRCFSIARRYSSALALPDFQWLFSKYEHTNC